MTPFFLSVSGTFVGNRDIVTLSDQDSLRDVEGLEDRKLDLGQDCYLRQVPISSSAGLVSFERRAEGQQT